MGLLLDGFRRQKQQGFDYEETLRSIKKEARVSLKRNESISWGLLV